MKSQVLGFLWTCSPPHRCVSGQHHWTELSSWEGGCAWLTTVRPVPTATMSPSTSRPIPGISNAEARQPGKAPNFSVNWTVGDSAIEVINATTGKDELGRASRLCKHALYCRWMRVHGKVLRRPDPPPTRGHPSLSPLAALSWQSGPASSDPKQAHPTMPVPQPHMNPGLSTPSTLPPSAWQALPLTADSWARQPGAARSSLSPSGSLLNLLILRFGLELEGFHSNRSPFPQIKSSLVDPYVTSFHLLSRVRSFYL